MTITLNGTTGITTPAVTNEGAYTGDGVVFADATPSNTLVTDTSGNVGIGTSSPSFKLDVSGANGNGIRYLAAGGTSVIFGDAGGNSAYIGTLNNYPVRFTVNDTERMRIDSSGNVGIGGTPTCILDVLSASNQNVNLFRIFSSQYSVNTLQARAVAANSASSTNAALYVGQNSGTSRSINAGGTINASGADYAEYMTKAGSFTINKGDICGIDADGKLTNVFANSISFVVKSTAPSYVGGDSWFTEQEPTEQSEMAEWEARMEAARQTVDRIAFSGQVPVNVTGATAGQYIIPVNDNGAIKGEAVSNPTFEQYQIAVGKVIAIEQDGRAKIIVKVA